MAYLDHAATTPMRPEAIEAVSAQMADVGNASSLHASGRRARRVVEESREVIAAAIGATPSEVIFTAGGTEANNLAIKGLFWRRREDHGERHRIVLSSVEHHALLDPARWLKSADNARVDEVAVGADGRVDPCAVTAAVASDAESVAVVSVMLANNEVGALQPVAEVVQQLHEFQVPVHTDAVQALGQVPVNFRELGVDALSVSAHKLGGPTGIGALVLARGTQPVPLLHGGGQEAQIRSGTLTVPAIAGFAAAMSAALSDREERTRRVKELRDRLIAGVKSQVPSAVLNGPDPDSDLRLPGNVHFSFPGCEGDALLLLLDAKGVECSTGSACSAGVAQPSHVLLAMGATPQIARSSLRFSLGWNSTAADVDAAVAAIGPAVERALRVRAGGSVVREAAASLG
ncbi:MAG TPA: cysteine desulfurase NifS [Actinobacteria bacterium]|nr:cysteine desulfurase NifS [Actinomycetota bacterium]